MNEEKIAKEIETYKELAKKDKNIDVASLMMNALQKSDTNTVPIKEKRWAYLISVGLPPFGLIFAAKFYWSDRDDGQETAFICVLLTALAILSFVVIGKLLLSGSGTSLNDLQKIKPSDIQELTQ